MSGMTKAGILAACLAAFAGGRLAEATDAKPQWVVAWKGVGDTEAQSAEKTRGYAASKTANTLAGYMSKVLGTEVKTAPWEKAEGANVILVTEAKYVPEDVRKPLEDKRLDAFVIKNPYEFEGRKVCLLLSRDPDGYDFPAYYFLTKYMGVDWVGAGEEGEIVPSQPDWKMPDKIDVLKNPDYEHRAWRCEGLDVRCWLADSRRLQFHHNTNKVFDPRVYADQPDLYPFYEGRRHVPDASIRRQRIAGWQVCTTNPKAVPIAVEYGLNYLKDRPESRSFGLSVNDGLGYCTCDACRALDSKGAWDHGNPQLGRRFFDFYNQVIEKVLEKNPNAWMAVLGYSRLEMPPSDIKINPRIIVFNCVDNNNPIPDMSERQRKWKEAGATPSLYFRMNDSGYMVVQHYPHAMADMIRLTHDLGGFGLYTEASTIWAAGGPKFYVLAHLLWDTKADVDELLDRYMRLAFGPEAAPAARAYYDRWEEVWERKGPVWRYDTCYRNKDYDQLDDLTRADLEAMDAALAKAQAAKASPAEKKRLEYVATYYKWLRINADQYLLAREFADGGWVEKRSDEDVLGQAERALALSAEYDRILQGAILADKSGWLRTKGRPGEEGGPDESPNASVRGGVLAALEAGLDVAFGHLSERMLKSQPKEQVAAYWKGQASEHPNLAKWAKTQVDLLDKGPGKNLLANGDFEQGTPGDRPAIAGWSVGGASFEGIVRPVYAWEPGSGHEGGHAVGISLVREGSFSAAAPIEAGKRYRFSLWYKTSKNVNPTVRVYIQGLPAWRYRPEMTQGEWRPWSTTFSGDTLVELQRAKMKKRAAATEEEGAGVEAKSKKDAAKEGKAKTTAAKPSAAEREAKRAAREQQPKAAGEGGAAKTTDAERIAKKEAKERQAAAAKAAQAEREAKARAAAAERETKDRQGKPAAEKQLSTNEIVARIQLQAKTLDKDEWVWFDDVELVQIAD